MDISNIDHVEVIIIVTNKKGGQSYGKTDIDISLIELLANQGKSPIDLIADESKPYIEEAINLAQKGKD